MIDNADNPVWVIVEQSEGQIPAVCLELLGKARNLAEDLGASTEAVFLGGQDEQLAEGLFHYGADKVYRGDSPVYEEYQSELYTGTIAALANEAQPQIILFGSTFVGRELAPLIAATLETGITAHCIDLEINEDQIMEQWIPAYGGLIAITCPEKRPQIATVAQGVFPKMEPDHNRTGEIVQIKPPEGIRDRVKTLEVVRLEVEGVSLEEARIVVAGGAGAGSPEGWQKIKDLTEVLSAGLGSTRPAVDEGWTDLETMIGQSGKMVNPEFYIGIGLSGEQQHMVGINDAKVMVAINNDPKSPVFNQVDLGIIEDCREFVPILIRKLRERLK
jgi:electron transfer flavoprotein alpha subunit